MVAQGLLVSRGGVASSLFRSVHWPHRRWEGFTMNIVENVASGLLVALVVWGCPEGPARMAPSSHRSHST